jgi:antitoxin PrlF
MAVKQLDLESESTLTNRYQTTIPQLVRKTLGLDKNDKIRYTVQKNGTILLSKLEKDEEDQVLENFLKFLDRDMRNNPQHIYSVNSDFIRKTQTLVAEVEVDFNSSLSDEDE